MPDADPTPLSRRSRAGLVRVGHGLHRPHGSREESPQTLRLDALAWQSLLPRHSCMAGLTSAQLRDWWLPPLPEDLPVFVAQHQRTRSSDRPELRVARHPTEPVWDEIDGLRVMAPAETLLACARHLRLLDLVVLVDCVLHHGWASREQIAAVATQRRRGAPRLREALTLADERSESPWETLLRILHIVCGIEVEPQHELLDATGGFVARGDLWLLGTAMFHEYDGGGHLKRERQRKDLKRARRITNEHWDRHGYTREDVLYQGVTILRDPDLAIGREHDPSRVRAWHALLRESLFTPAGTAAFRVRIGLPREPASRPA